MELLRWKSLQTRTLEDHHNIKPHKYKTELKPPLNQKINIISRNEKHSTYSTEKYPLIVTLLHTKKNHRYQYNPTGTIINALETYQTIVHFKNEF